MASPALELATADTVRWQRKLLPYMTHFLVVLAVGFFALSAFEIYELRSFVSTQAGGSARQQIVRMVGVDGRFTAMPEVGSLLILEADAMDNRYRQASSLLMSRIWTRQLAFMTGMVLSFIGAVFILGKLSEARSDVSVGGGEWKGAVSSSSPGLILAFFGTVLMAISLIVQPKIEVQDRPVYLQAATGSTGGVVAGAPSAPPPPIVPQGLQPPAK